ncbi:solute carrier family 22 member 16 isoform X2 [Zalophus californianus]|uniref:Solute carrier family 22 member 16 isoform X2 n=1 Tax=Zalophus californianus TaxID=9704 RepID=A0A6J2DK74_ZALCA|nr:solute carrier family 22 member 16 isoform X2 [Zalophus californianus]
MSALGDAQRTSSRVPPALQHHLPASSFFLPLAPCSPAPTVASGFQIVLYFICAFQNISCGIHYLASVFMTVSPYHTCRPPGNVSQVLFHNISSWRLEDIWILFFTGHEDQIIVQLQNGEVWELTSCHRFRRDEKSGLNSDYNGQKSSFPCLDGYIYDKSKWDSTVVTQWDLVCNREWFAKMVQPVFMLGVLLGAMIFGYLSDRLGRRLVLWSTSTGIFFFGIAVAFSSDYYSFMIARFLLAMSGSGYLVVVFVYVTEFIGMKSRTWACIQMHSFFAIGTMVVALTGYFVRTWWTYQIVLSTVTVPFVVCCWILPETPFWLLSEGRYEEAQRVVDTMAKWNRASSCKLSELLSLDLNGPVGNEPFEVKKHNLLDLFYDWNVGTRTLIVWLIWFTGCLGFYFFSLNSVNLGGNEYLNLFLMGAVEIPAYVFICWGMDSIGRRNVLVFSLISGALLCGVVMVIPKDYLVWTVVVTMAGKFAIGASFGLIYLYTAELYPTMVPGCGKRQHGEPCGKHRGPVLGFSLQRLDLPTTAACWDFGLRKWSAVANTSRNHGDASGNDLGGGCQTGYRKREFRQIISHNQKYRVGKNGSH